MDSRQAQRKGNERVSKGNRKLREWVLFRCQSNKHTGCQVGKQISRHLGTSNLSMKCKLHVVKRNRETLKVYWG